MMGMPERIPREDIKKLNEIFEKVDVAGLDDESLVLIKKIDLLRKQDEIASDASVKITALQDEIYSLYRKDDENGKGE